MTTTADPREVARWARIVTANRLICVRADDWMNCGNGGTHHGGAEFCTPIGRLADAFEEMAMAVDAREVARAVWLNGHCYRKGDVSSGFQGNDPAIGRPRQLAGSQADIIDNLHPGDPMPDLLTTTPPPRRCAIPLLVELCAGTAALSLRLERAKARPPVSRMGAKTGYADAILALAGLQPGDKAERYLWCEPDDGVRLLLHAYRDAELAREAAAIIRGWADEEPRALWERLRAEGPAVCPPADAREVGRWLNSQAWGATGYWCGPDRGGQCGTHPPGWVGSITSAGIASRADGLGGIPATIHDDARTLDPCDVAAALQCPPVDAREVGRFAVTWNGSFSGKGPAAGYCPTVDADGVTRRQSEAKLALLLERGGLPATIHDDARTLDPCPGECWPRHDSLDEALGCMRCQRASERSRAGAVQVPPGTLAYIDPPYLNTTGYADLFPRSEWVPVVRRWADAGARCMVSEAEPIPELMADGWHAVEITAMRQGQKRTFSKQQREFITCNFEPDARARLVCERALERLTMREAATVGGEQADLFGGA